MAIPRMAAVVKRNRAGDIMTVYAVCDDADKAHATAENANRWYGESHPMTPLTVYQDVLLNPPPFPESM